MNTRVIAIAIFTVAVGVFGLLFVPGQNRPAPLSNDECSVYRAVAELYENDHVLFFAPLTSPYKARSVSSEPVRLHAPSRFRFNTGKTELRSLIGDGDLVEWPIFEDFTFDTGSMFAPVISPKRRNLTPCFDGVTGAPIFTSGPFWWLRLQRMLTANEAPETHRLNWVHVSPIGFSEDRSRALVYTEYDCGGWCGGGHFLLLERQNGTWIELGYAMVWVA